MTDGDRTVPTDDAPQDGTTVVEAMCFRLGGAVLCIPVDQVAEVVQLGPVTRLFHLPDWFVGVAALRGEILQVLDLARLLGHNVDVQGGHVLVVDTALGRAGFPVEEVLGVRMVTISGEGGRLEEGLPLWASTMGEVDGRTVTVLDMSAFNLDGSGPSPGPDGVRPAEGRRDKEGVSL